MPEPLREQSAGEIVRNTFATYGRHFRPVFLAFFLPMFPLTFLCAELDEGLPERWQGSIAMLAALLVTPFAYAATTLILSDSYLGIRPSVRRAYGAVFRGFALRIISTNFIAALAVILGLVLLLIPGFIVGAWILLVTPVIILERQAHLSAIRRSKQLGDGFHWRNIGVLLVVGAILCVFWILGFILCQAVSSFFLAEISGEWNSWDRYLAALLQAIAEPAVIVALVLIYYDMRIRKEAYDITLLGQDLRR
jgi:hypothetical protein